MRLWFLPFYFICLLWLKWRAKSLYKGVKVKNKPYDKNRAYHLVRRICQYTKFLYKFKIEVQGLKNIPDKKMCLITPNHQSNFDPILMILAMPKKTYPAFIAKEELLKDWKVNSFLKIIYSFPLNRQSLRQSLEIINASTEHMIKNKSPLIIFPEGTRSKSKEMGEFKPGAFKPAFISTAPIIPVTIVNSIDITSNIHKRMINNSFSKKMKPTIKIIFHTPVKYDNFHHKNTTSVAEEVKKIIGKSI
ncbi:hypothetical protein ASO20_02495 [Mycoplasma sp. (ex Biomphalaria glabrata)]|nr:hypothetical protein ASO20_02495 [Mycoplasma sp. (ex Biomphalaria glabrata)]